MMEPQLVTYNSKFALMEHQSPLLYDSNCQETINNQESTCSFHLRL